MQRSRALLSRLCFSELNGLVAAHALVARDPAVSNDATFGILVESGSEEDTLLCAVIPCMIVIATITGNDATFGKL